MRAWLSVALTAALVAPTAAAAPSSTPLLSALPPPPVLTPPPSASGTPSAASSAALPPVGSDTCREHVPEGKERPKLTEEFPARGESGHALTLSLTLEHGKGETVLPGGFQLQTADPTFRGLERVGLYLPDPNGGAGPVLTRTEHGDRATTHVEISFVPLPQKPGRNVLVVPPLPISVARASGDVLVLCTEPHEVTLEDPIANTSDPKPRSNPPAREQLEVWTALKNALFVGAISLGLGALVAFLIGKWLRRPRPVPPPPPPRPPWEVAMEELFDIRHAGLVAEGRLAEHFDRVSDSVRKYLGARFGFDGLESTTREALGVLRDVKPRLEPLDTIEGFLRQADLVKFAKTTPTAEDGELALVRAEHIVRETLPTTPALPPPGAATLDAPTETLAAAPAVEAPKPVDDEAATWGPKSSAPPAAASTEERVSHETAPSSPAPASDVPPSNKSNDPEAKS